MFDEWWLEVASPPAPSTTDNGDCMRPQCPQNFTCRLPFYTDYSQRGRGTETSSNTMNASDKTQDPSCKCGQPRTQGHFTECRMVRPFLPEIPEKESLLGAMHLIYLLGARGYKGFQRLVEDTSPNGALPNPRLT
ncbi:hypothetical protein TARUN_10369 [Trichoderma arundinaceum]|uniref:Uncharacterized protein n=1 Tax=Trichoderma arundinaceum TaxID=490622 RepID=A0A395N879_TRIAR|nr:hypothetical protein TARUN_10369 [Trichoderma arundinaceum]